MNPETIRKKAERLNKTVSNETPSLTPQSDLEIEEKPVEEETYSYWEKATRWTARETKDILVKGGERF